MGDARQVTLFRGLATLACRSLLTLSIALVVPSPTFAQQRTAPSAPYSLSWVRGEGAEGCPDRRALKQAIEERLGRQVFDPAGQRSIEVHITRGPAGFRSTAYLRDAEGHLQEKLQLSVNEPACEPVVSATAVACALAIERAGRGQARQGNGQAPLRVDWQMSGAERSVKGDAGAARRRTEVAVAGRVLASAATVPSVAPGAMLLVEGRPKGGAWGWELGALYMGAQDTDSPEIGRFKIGLTALTVAVARDIVKGSGHGLVLDAGLTTGALHSASNSPVAVDLGDYLFLALGIGARIYFELAPELAFEIGGYATAPLYRLAYNYTVDGEAHLTWRQPAMGGFGFLGLRSHFP